MFKRSCLRYAHTDGNTHCCYTDDGKYVITTGSDGDIRTWNGVDDDDPNTQCVCEQILYHAFYENQILTSTDLNTVQSFTFPDYGRDGTEFRFAAPVTCIKINDRYVAACSEDTTIKIKSKVNSNEEFEFADHTGPILRIDLSPTNLLASSSGDGSIKIWNLDERKCIKTISGFDEIKTYQMTFAYVTPSFEPKNGSYMAYNHNNSIFLRETASWAVKKTLSDEENESRFTVCSYSKCGKYIAAGSENGTITIWNICTGVIIRGSKQPNAIEGQCITSISWNPNNSDELAYTDKTGQFGLIVNICGANDNILIGKCDMYEENEDINFGDIKFTDDPNDAENENCISIEKLKNETMKKTDEDLEKLDRASLSYGDDTNDERNVSMAKIQHAARLYQAQMPFQPSETQRSLEHRYMVWNHVGIVRSHTSNTENSIEVEFHDANIHHGLHMVNHLNHTMASLSSTVLALCNETSSKLVCIMLGGSRGSREWSVSMPNCEEILCVAASSKQVVVATDARFLRIFSSMGTQREVISLPGQAVSVAAHNNLIQVAYHSSASTEDQHISLMFIEVVGLNLRCRNVSVPLSPGAKLTWVGYSDKGSPITYDSKGSLRLYSSRSNVWIPVCDTTLHTTGASDNFFIVQVSEASQVIRAVLCRGSNYPLTTPKPMVAELKMQMPVCDIESEQSQLEETLIRYGSFNADDSDKHIKETALKLFSIACRSENEIRAKELVEMVGMPAILSLAIKYANSLGRIHLVERLSELEPQFNKQEDERKKHDENDHDNISNNTSIRLINAKQNKETTLSKTLPKPLSISQLSRNPFKKGSVKIKEVSNNNFKHLTEQAMGFDSQYEANAGASSGLDAGASHGSDTLSCKENTEAETTKPKKNFVQWFNERKDGLQKENPNLSSDELMKFAMNEFRSKRSTIGDTNCKRKIISDDDNEQSGVSKLARFSFNKY